MSRTRQHPDAASWSGAPVRKVLVGIEAYYHLDHMPQPAVDDLAPGAVRAQFAVMGEEEERLRAERLTEMQAASRTAMVSGFGFGGQNSVAVFKKWED